MGIGSFAISSMGYFLLLMGKYGPECLVPEVEEEVIEFLNKAEEAGEDERQEFLELLRHEMEEGIYFEHQGFAESFKKLLDEICPNKIKGKIVSAIHEVQEDLQKQTRRRVK